MSLFFVHIPKTAGTSFRLGAEDYFDSSKIVYDYGPKSVETSDLVKKYLYENRADFWKFGKTIDISDISMLAGHVHLNRFVSLVGIGKVLSFVRDPLQRMASEYAHFVRHYEYKGSFHDFYSRPIMHNRQSKMLQGAGLEAIGFVGLTENYNLSLALINQQYGIQIPLREDNQGKSQLDELHEISKEDSIELERLNKGDIALYEQAKALFDQRVDCFNAGKSWAHARLVEVNENRVSGWAWWAEDSDRPVDVEIWVNNTLIDIVTAIEYRPGLCRFLPPRGAYVGFSLLIKLSVGDLVQCKIATTGQYFPITPCKVEVLNT